MAKFRFMVEHANVSGLSQAEKQKYLDLIQNMTREVEEERRLV